MLEKKEYVLAVLLDLYPQGKIEDIDAFNTDIDLQKDIFLSKHCRQSAVRAKNISWNRVQAWNEQGEYRRECETRTASVTPIAAGDDNNGGISSKKGYFSIYKCNWTYG